jgi:hypothetical protein
MFRPLILYIAKTCLRCNEIYNLLCGTRVNNNKLVIFVVFLFELGITLNK